MDIQYDCRKRIGSNYRFKKTDDMRLMQLTPSPIAVICGLNLGMLIPNASKK